MLYGGLDTKAITSQNLSRKIPLNNLQHPNGSHGLQLEKVIVVQFQFN